MRYLSSGLETMGVVTCVSIICGFLSAYSSEKDKPCDQRTCTSADNTHYCDIITARPHDDIYILLHTTLPFSLLQSFVSFSMPYKPFLPPLLPLNYYDFSFSPFLASIIPSFLDLCNLNPQILRLIE